MKPSPTPRHSTSGLTEKQQRAIKVQVLRDHLEYSKRSPYGIDCGSALCALSGVFSDWPEMEQVLKEIHEFARETERKRGWI